MSVNEWAALGIFALAAYALSFFSVNAALFLIIGVGVAAFVTRSQKASSAAPAKASKQ